MNRQYRAIILLFCVFLLAACMRSQSNAPQTSTPPAPFTPTGEEQELERHPTPSSTSPRVSAAPEQGTPSTALEEQPPTSSPGSATPTDHPDPTSTPSTTPASPKPTVTQTQAPIEDVSATAETTPETETRSDEGEESGNDECTNMAAFEQDVTIPDNTRLRQGESFVKTWRIYNAGSCAWGAGYSLVFDSGNLLGASSPYILPEVVSPGHSVDISLNMTAPQEGGQWYGNWKFSDAEGAIFGVGTNRDGPIWVQILVNFIEPTPSADQVVGAVCKYELNPAYISELLNLLNNARTAAGRAPLVLDSALSAAATAHSKDMACQDFVDHRGSDGIDWFGRIRAQGYVYSRATENIYVGNPEFGGVPQGAFDWWMKSQIHHDNILDPLVTEVGIGYVYSTSSTYRGYYTMVFAAP